MRAAETTGQPVRLALVSDTHVTRFGAEHPAYRAHFELAIVQVNAAEVDAVLMAGDLTEHGNVDEFREFKDLARRFQAPIFCVPGNHDVGDKRLDSKTGGVTGRRVATYEGYMGPSYLAADVRGVRVVGVNASLIGSGLRREAEQRAFLQSELAEPSGSPRLVFMHYPPFLERPDEPGDPYWNLEREPRVELIALMQCGRVDAVLCGHLHRPLRVRHHGTLYFAGLSVAFGIPEGTQAEGWTLITVDLGGDVVPQPQPFASSIIGGA